MIRSGVLTRRRFVKLVGAAAAVSVVPFGCGGPAAAPDAGPTPDAGPPPPRGRFFDAHQWATIDLAASNVLPSEAGVPGAHEAMVVRYIDNLLSAFDDAPPHIFAGGPASNRNAIPDAHGAPTTTFPPNAFATFLPLSRIREIAWRMRIFGSAATPGGDFNDGLLGPRIGLRDLYVAGVVALDAAAAGREPGKQYIELSVTNQSGAISDINSAHGDFVRALTEHTLEGTFSAPEYGGNEGLVGWTLARWDGDSVPLGHSFYDATTGAYVDRADQPTSTPSPGASSEDFDARVTMILATAAVGSGGMRFF